MNHKTPPIPKATLQQPADVEQLFFAIENRENHAPTKLNRRPSRKCKTQAQKAMQSKRF